MFYKALPGANKNINDIKISLLKLQKLIWNLVNLLKNI